MPLDWGDTAGNANGVDLGLNVRDDTAECTMVGWFRLNTLTDLQFPRIYIAGADNLEILATFKTLESYRLRFERTYSSVRLVCRSADDGIAPNIWQFFAVVDHGPTVLPRMYVGTRGTMATEVGYSTQTAGTGTVSDTSSLASMLGNRDTLNSGWRGRLGSVAIYRRAFTLYELKLIQRNPLAYIDLCNGLWLPGRRGQRTFVRDETRWGNNGTGNNANLVPVQGQPVVPGFDFRKLHLPLATPFLLNNKRISSMHFQRHYEPIAVGT